MARTTQRRVEALGELTNAQIWHLMRGLKFYEYSGFRMPKCPFQSPEERKEAWFRHRDRLMAMAREPLPESVMLELHLVLKYRKPGTTWSFRPLPAAAYEYDPGGSETATPPPTPAGANVPMPMTTPSPAEASDEAGRRP